MAYNSLRAHLRVHHQTRELPWNQIGLYENYPGARHDMVRSDPNAQRPSVLVDEVTQAAMLTAAVNEGKICSIGNNLDTVITGKKLKSV